MARQNVTIEFTGDTRNLVSGIDDVTQALADQEKQAMLAEQGLQKIALSAGAIATGIGLLGVQATQTGVEFEKLKTALATSLGSKGEAEKAFNNILEFAKATPFQVQEITSSFVKLQNQGITPTEETLRRLGDIAASQGKGIDQITEAILDAAQGEGERLKEFGIKASFAGSQAQIAFKGVNLAVEKTPEAIAEAVLSLGDLQGVAGGMEAQSKTLGGSLSNLQDNVDQASLAFFEMSGSAIKSVVDAANGLISSFVNLDPALQKVIFATAGLTAAVSAAVAILATYNLLKGSMVATEIAAAAATLNSTLTMSGLAAATTAAATATGGLIAAFAPLLAKFALIVAAAESIRQAYQSVARDGGEDFRASTETLRKGLLDLEVQTSKTSDVMTKELKPARRSWTDFFGSQAAREVNQAKIAVRDFRGEVGNSIDAAQKLGNSAEDTAKKQEILTNAQTELTKQIAALNETELGTEAYRELRAELEVSQKELDKWAGLLGVTTQKAETNTAQTAEQTKAIAEQTAALEKQAQVEADKEKTRRDAEKAQTALDKEDAGVKESRQREDAQRKRQEDNAKAIANIQAAQQLESAKLAEQQQLDLQAKQKQFEAEQAALKEQQTTEEEQAKLAFEASLNSQKESAAEKEQAIADAEREAAAIRERNFTTEIEALKDEAATKRQAAERALAAEISTRLEQQSKSFGTASKLISQAGELAAAATEEERQKLVDEFARLDAQAKAIASLNLADQVLSPEQLIATAERVSGISGVKSAEDARALQDALAAIQEEQRKQQAEADKASELALQAELQATARAFDDELKGKQRAFEAETQQINLANEAAKRERDLAFEAELNQQKLTFEAAQKAQRLADDAELQALKTQQEAILLEKKKADELAIAQLKAQQEAVLEEKRKAFEDSERTLQRNFEDEQRTKERAFNESERMKDEASAQKIADILAKAKPPEAPVTNVVPRFKGGAVVPGQLYLGGELNPEPIAFGNGKTAMVGLNGPELFRVPQSGMVYPSIKAMAGVGGSDNSALLAEVQRLNQTLSRRSPSGSDTYNIVGVQDPVRATITMQQERIKQRARMARI